MDFKENKYKKAAIFLGLAILLGIMLYFGVSSNEFTHLNN